MGYFIAFEINDLPKMANASGSKSTHWRYAKAEVDKWHQLVWWSVAHNKPAKPLKKAKLILTRYSSVAPDYDGLVRGFKSVVDGLVRCDVLKDDSLKVTGPWVCEWKKTAEGMGKIRVEVIEDSVE